MDYDDLIQYENEHTGLDFKATQYLKAEHGEFLKDTLAMANAQVDGYRYIIVGVKHRAAGEREYLGLRDVPFVDASIYQQLVRENIEPDVPLDYIPHEIDGTVVGVLRIGPCPDPPYMMRKKFGDALVEGDAYIRKGTHKHRLSRGDLERIYSARSRKQFEGKVDVAFQLPASGKTVQIRPAVPSEPPSERAAREIREILQQREAARRDPERGMFGHRVMLSPIDGLFGNTPYNRRTDEELKRNLQEVHVDYRDEDDHQRYESQACLVNLSISNSGEAFLEDVSIEVAFPLLEGLNIPDRVYDAPQRVGPMGYIPSFHQSSSLSYPRVTTLQKEIRVSAELGDVRHGVPKLAFEEPLRLVADSVLSGQNLEVQYWVRARQLPQPVAGSLIIVIDAGS